MKSILKLSVIAGIVIFITSYGILYIAVRLFPTFFTDYFSPVFHSDGSRDIFFYLHPFVLSLAMSVLWNRFKNLFHGSIWFRGFEFGALYAGIALIPVMWITYSAVDVSLTMVLSWLAYGFFQSVMAGILFARLDP